MNRDAAEAALAEALGFLATFTDYEQKAADQLGRNSLDLGRMRALAAELGNPERSCGRVFHVAGSKGKGSVTLTLDHLLRGQGLITGRFLSPHLEQVTERIAVSGRDVSPSRFAALVDRLRPLVTRLETANPGLLPSFFEAVTLMAFLDWQEAGCEAAVLEVGLGGRLDATNIVDPLVSIITIIDLEHTRILGESLAEIAGEKAGIVKARRPVISASPRLSAAGRVIAARAEALGAPLHVLGEEFVVKDRARRDAGRVFDFEFADFRMTDLETSVLGRHQIDNLGLCLAALVIAQQQGLLVLDQNALRRDLVGLALPARQQFIPRADSGLGVDLILDTAHTPQSMASLTRTLEESFPQLRTALLVGMLRDKKAGPCMQQMAGRFDRVFVTAPDSPRAMNPAELEAAAAVTTRPGARISQVEAGLAGLDLDGIDLLVVTGSVYLAGAIAGELRRGRRSADERLS